MTDTAVHCVIYHSTQTIVYCELFSQTTDSKGCGLQNSMLWNFEGLTKDTQSTRRMSLTGTVCRAAAWSIGWISRYKKNSSVFGVIYYVHILLELVAKLIISVLFLSFFFSFKRLRFQRASLYSLFWTASVSICIWHHVFLWFIILVKE